MKREKEVEGYGRYFKKEAKNVKKFMQHQSGFGVSKA